MCHTSTLHSPYCTTWHDSWYRRYGYSSLAQVQGVVANYSAAGIPLEAIWLDIDYSECPVVTQWLYVCVCIHCGCVCVVFVLVW